MNKGVLMNTKTLCAVCGEPTPKPLIATAPSFATLAGTMRVCAKCFAAIESFAQAEEDGFGGGDYKAYLMRMNKARVAVEQRMLLGRAAGNEKEGLR